MKTRDIYGGNYLTAEDLNGKPVTVTVIDVTVATIGKDGKKKAVLHFKNTDKCLPLNVTNANMMEELTGSDDTDEWVGCRIGLYPTKVDFQGKRVLAIRLQPAQAVQAAPAARQARAKPSQVSEPETDDFPPEITPDSDDIPF